jgi:hypothetical protein
MGLFNFFKKKEQPVEQPKEIETYSDGNPKFVDGKRFCNHECSKCGKIIGEDRYSKQGGVYFHKKCYSKVKQDGFNGR